MNESAPHPGREEPENAASDVVRVGVPERGRVVLGVKRFLQGCFGVLAIRRLLVYWTLRRCFGRRAFLGASESIGRVPGLRGVYLRQAFYRRTLEQCGQDVHIGWSSVFSMPEARLGDRVYIGRFCSIGYADLGSETMLADGVQILSGGREHQVGVQTGSRQQQTQTYRRVRIGAGAWIGAGAIVMADVADGAIVGAGAVVTRPIPPHQVAAGIPARVLEQNQMASDSGSGRLPVDRPATTSADQ